MEEESATPWGQELESIEDAARKGTEALADRYRLTVLIPLCKKHGLTFVSGMGTFFFVSGDDAIHEHNCPDYLDEVFEVLNTHTFDRFEFGFFVGDIREEDLVEPAARKETTP